MAVSLAYNTLDYHEGGMTEDKGLQASVVQIMVPGTNAVMQSSMQPISLREVNGLERRVNLPAATSCIASVQRRGARRILIWTMVMMN